MYCDVPIVVAAKLPTRERRLESADHCGHRGNWMGSTFPSLLSSAFPRFFSGSASTFFQDSEHEEDEKHGEMLYYSLWILSQSIVSFLSLSGLFIYKDKYLNYSPAFSPLASPCLDEGETSWSEYLHKQTLQHCLLGGRAANGCILFSAPTLLPFPSRVLLYENSVIGTQRSQTAWSHLHRSQKMWTAPRHPQSC